jgi:uncharacterized protein with beta-barrel porin domain
MTRSRHHALPLSAFPIVTVSRCCLLGLGLLVMLSPAPAEAQCVQDGTTVTCEGADPDGFDAGGTDGLAVDVLPDATVDNGGADGVNTLNLANGNTVDVRAGVPGQTADAAITASGTGSHGIRALDGNTLTNSGTISADGSGGIGVLLGAAGGTGNELDNFGTITGGAGSGAAVSLAPSDSGSETLVSNRQDGVLDGSASGLAVLGSAGSDTVRNRGTIIGDVDLAGGDDFFGLSTAGFVDGAVTGGAGTDTVRLFGFLSNVADLTIFSGFEALEVLDNGAWLFSGSGSFPDGTTVAAGRIFLDETVNLSGDYLQGTGTSLVVRLDPDGTNDLLVVDGDATIEAGATLELLPTDTLIDEATYTFLTTTGSLTGIFDELSVFGGSSVLDFTQVATANSLAVEFSRNLYASAAATSNQLATATHLDDIFAAGATGDMALVLANLDTLSEPELQAAFDALHPEAYDAQASSTFAFGRSVAELAAFRRPRCEDVVYEPRPEVILPSPCSSGWTLWGSGFGLFADRNGDSGHIDFGHDGGGLLLGADHPLGEHFLLYGFLGGGYTSVDVDAVGNGHFYSATLGVGGRWSLGGTRIHGLVGYARGWHEQKRNIDFADISRTAKGDYGSNLITALVKAGHTFRFGNLDVEPLATVEYGYLMEESFDESGAGDVDLDVDKRSNSLLSTTVGARLAYTYFKWEYVEDFLEWADGVWTPEVSARWRGNWIDTKRDFDARMAGDPVGVGSFRVTGKDATQGVQVGAGVSFQPLRILMSIRLDYDGFYGDGSMIHRIGASVRVPLGGSAS